MKIKKIPDRFLRRKATKVARVGDSERRMLQDMAEAMYTANGVGLAAQQVGIDKQLAVVDVGDGLMKLINPRIVRKEGCVTQEEGCLSVPDTIVKVRRAERIVVDYLNADGALSQIRAEGLLARAIQHETDHLSGKLIIDYLNPIKRLFLKKRRASK